jgi:hypothetical protein
MRFMTTFVVAVLLAVFALGVSPVRSATGLHIYQQTAWACNAPERLAKLFYLVADVGMTPDQARQSVGGPREGVYDCGAGTFLYISFGPVATISLAEQELEIQEVLLLAQKHDHMFLLRRVATLIYFAVDGEELAGGEGEENKPSASRSQNNPL